MKYKLGDFVRFVDEKMEGYVTRIFDEQMIGVTGADDFEIPVLAAKVTTVHGHRSGVGGDDGAKNDTVLVVGDFISRGIYLGIIADPKANAVVHFQLVNTTSFHLLASLTTDNNGKFKGEYYGIITPLSALKIWSAQLADLHSWPQFRLSVLFHTTLSHAPPEPLIFKAKFRAKDFAGAKKKVPVLDQTGWLIQLDEPEVSIDPQKLKESFYKPLAEKTLVEKPTKEIDLHIEKLRNDYQFIDSNKILNVQIAYFNKMLDAAIVHQLTEIIFIHGSGNGVLKNAIHKALGKNNKIETFMDARKDRFGYGATRVLLK